MIIAPSEFGWHKSERRYAVGWFGNRATNIFRLSADNLVGFADFWLLKIIRNTRKALLLAELRNITSQQKLPITPGKPQAATQAKYAFVSPAPYLPVSCKKRSGSSNSIKPRPALHRRIVDGQQEKISSACWYSSNKDFLQLTQAKPQAATQAKYAFVPPAP